MLDRFIKAQFVASASAAVGPDNEAPVLLDAAKEPLANDIRFD